MDIRLETVFFVFIGIAILISAIWIIKTEKRLKRFFAGKKAKDLEENKKIESIKNISNGVDNMS